MSAFSLRSPVRRSAWHAALAASALLFTAGAHAAQPASDRKSPPSLGEKTSEAFGRLKAMQDAKDWAGMIKLLDAVPAVRPGSYDEAVILDTKARIYGAMEQSAKALAPWERALELSDQHGYFADHQVREIVGYLAQLFAQEALATKDPATQRTYFGKSLQYFQRSWENTKSPTPEAMLTYASLLFHQATVNPEQADTALLEQAREVVDRGLLAAVKPKVGFYQMRLALLQQQNDHASAAELLELLVQQKPDAKDYWQALVNIYQQLSLKAKETDPALAHEYLVRAVVTFERAQSLGFLDTPKDNLALASVYLMANQFTKGTELLHAGLQRGTIESEPNNWRLLGRFHQEANQPARARAVLEEAVKLFPANGEIEAQLAHVCIQLENTADALRHAQAAAAKGNFETTKPFSVHYLIAYTAFDLGRFEEAQAAITAAEAYPDDVAKDAQFPTLKAVIAEAIAEEERKKDAAAKPAAQTGRKSGGE